MSVEEMKSNLKKLIIGENEILTKHFPMTTRVCAQHLIKELEANGEIIDPDIKELFKFEDSKVQR